MELFRIKNDIPFMSYGRLTTTISLVTFILAVFFLATRGLNFGVDFTGGTIMEVSYPQAANLESIRKAVDNIGLKEATVQNFGSSRDVLIRLPAKTDISVANLSEHVKEALVSADPAAEVRRVEAVGAQVGAELYENGALALFFVIVGIMLYLWLRFEWRFAVAAIIANMHDVVIILGFFAFFQWDFNLTVLAAILAVLGYSVNESVVVFDRVRENFRKMRKASVVQVIDNAIYPHHVTYHHHALFYTIDGVIHALVRRRSITQLCPRPHHWYFIRHLLISIGCKPNCHVPWCKSCQLNGRH